MLLFFNSPFIFSAILVVKACEEKTTGPKGLIKSFCPAFYKKRAAGGREFDTSPVPHGHPKNDAAPCGKHLRVTRGTQDGQKKRTKKSRNLSILKPGKNNRRTALVSDGPADVSRAKLLKKFDQNFW